MYSPLSWVLEMVQLSTNSLQEDTRERLPVDAAMIASDMGPVGEMVHEDVVAGGSSVHSMFTFYGVPAWIHTNTPHVGDELHTQVQIH